VTQNTREIEYALTHKGFSRENAKHHMMFWFYLDGRKTSVRTRLSYGASEIGDRLIGCMAREMRIPKADFLRFVECGMSGDDYTTKMISDGQVLR
jgi:hypothetical protein